jgi:signal transduction histidine kinase
VRTPFQWVIRSAFTVTGAQDADIERRSALLLWTAAMIGLSLVVAGATLRPAPGNLRMWLATVPIGVPTMLATFLLARRARADAAAWLLTGAIVWVLVMFAWIEGPSCNRMTAVMLGIVAIGAVLSTRLTALVGLGLAAMITGFAAAESVGWYHPIEQVAATEAAHAPFIRQMVFIALVVALLRRGYDRLVVQVRDREHACSAAVDAAQAITTSLEARVTERTSTLAATRDRLSGLAGRLATDLGGNLRTMRAQLDAFSSAEAAVGTDTLRAIAKASAAIERLSVMTDRLHDFAHAGATALRPERVAIDALAREVIDDYRRTSSAARIDWQVDPVPAAQADPALVRSIVENLISNAIKFSRRQPQPRIQIGHDPIRGYFVRDNGVGFDPDRAGELFRPFHRLHSEEFEGHGIGLANVRRMVERSGGELSVDSEPGCGSTFYFQLPREDDA